MKRFIVVAIASIAGCYDPVHEDDVATLGPEVPGIPEGANHRAGQRCTTCHSGKGPGDSDFVVAGTLYAVRGQPDPVIGGVITVTDAKGDARRLTSNGVGNFYLDKSAWSPAFPLHIGIEAQGVKRQMVSGVGRDGGCATCHQGLGDRSFMPGVFLRDK